MESQKQILEAVSNFQISRVILTALELKVFTALKNKMFTSEEVAAQIKTDPRATNRLMNALCAIGLLKKKNSKFYNSSVSAQYLNENSPDFISGLMHQNQLWKSWSFLTDSVISGTCSGNLEFEESWLEPFIEAMHYRGKEQAKILKYLIDFNNVNKMLDLGGGSGAFSIEFVEMNKEMKSVIFDLPEVIVLTKQYIEKAGCGKSIEFLEGDYLSDEIGQDYDLIFLSAVIHSHSPEENMKIFQKCSTSLNPAGKIVIVDFIMDETRIFPERGAFFSLNMLVNTNAGDTYTFNEVSKWLTAAGFSGITKKDTGFSSSIIFANK